MKGIQYIVDSKGQKKAVILDLKIHADLWEDIQDVLVARKRVNEPRIPLEEVKAQLRKNGKLR